MSQCRVLIVLWTTGRCNLECKYCYASQLNNKFDMKFKTAKKILDYFSDRPMKIQFAGGEPLLNYDLICKIYEYAKIKGYDIIYQLQTNATMIDLIMAREIKKMNIAVGVSMDGSPNINEWLRGRTKEAVYGIQCLAKAGISTNLNSVITDKNIFKLYEIADFALYLGNIQGIGLDLLRETGRAKENSEIIKSPTEKELKEGLTNLYKRCREIYKKTGKKFVIREIEDAKKRLKYSLDNKNYCYASCGLSYVFLPDGEVYPCGSLVNNKKYYMGNIHDNNIRSISLNNEYSRKCNGCEYESLCTKGCPSRMIVNQNESSSLDCTLKKAAFEIAMEEIK